MKDDKCFFRPKKEPHCAEAAPKNCEGMKGDHCKLKVELCHWDFQKTNNWETSCYPGPKESKEDPACVVRETETECKKDCLWRPKKSIKCAPKLAKYCQGVTGDQCKAETETCHWEYIQDDWEHSCKGGKRPTGDEKEPTKVEILKPKTPETTTTKPASMEQSCSGLEEENCLKAESKAGGKKCMFRPKEQKEAKCASATPKNCKGMRGETCKTYSDLCHWDFQKTKNWEDSCYPGPAGSPEEPACVLRTGEEECVKDCLWRPKSVVKCARKVPENCLGVPGEQCKKVQDTCHWEYTEGEWHTSCKPGAVAPKVEPQTPEKSDIKEPAKVVDIKPHSPSGKKACSLIESGDDCIKQDCLWRPKKNPECAPKLAENCEGTKGEQCKEEKDICHWEFSGDWTVACKSGPAQGQTAQAKSSSATSTTAKLGSSSSTSTPATTPEETTSTTVTTTSAASKMGVRTLAIFVAVAAAIAFRV